MTISAVRIYYFPRRERLAQYLAFTHWGFAEWFPRRLVPLRHQLRGPQTKGVPIVNFMLHEDPKRTWHADEWRQRLNTFEFEFVCDLAPLRDAPPLENIAKLMQFAAAMAAQAPWPQVRAVSTALAAPLSDEEKASLAPFLTWPRPGFFQKNGYRGERLQAMLDSAALEMKDVLREARYRTPKT